MRSPVQSSVCLFVRLSIARSLQETYSDDEEEAEAAEEDEEDGRSSEKSHERLPALVSLLFASLLRCRLLGTRGWSRGSSCFLGLSCYEFGCESE